VHILQIIIWNTFPITTNSCRNTIAFAQNGNELVKLTDMLKIKTVGNITVTADGTKAAFTVTSVEPDETSKLDYKYLTQVYYISTTAGATPVQLTTAKKALRNLPGAQMEAIGFCSPGQMAKPQIFILSMGGGEPTQLTKYQVWCCIT